MDEFDQFLQETEEEEADWVPLSPMPGDAAKPDCRHTLNHRDPSGTWDVREDQGRRLVACRRCGKFYGYLRDEEVPEPNKVEKTVSTRRSSKWWLGRKPAKEQTRLAL